MFSSSFFLCVLAELCNAFSTDFHKIRWKDGTWDTKEIFFFLDFGSNPDHVTSGLGLRAVVKVRARAGGLSPPVPIRAPAIV